MGWFSSKRRVTVALRFVQMAPDIKPETLKNTAIGAILQGVTLSKAFREEITRGFYSKAMSYYRYGISDFTGGLPQGVDVGFQLDQLGIYSIIDRVVGPSQYGRTIRSSTVDRLTPNVIAHKYIAEQYGWNAATNTLPANNPTPDRKFDSAYYDSQTEDIIWIKWVRQVNGLPEASIESWTHGYNLDNDHLVVEYCNVIDALETEISYMLLEDVVTSGHPELADLELSSNPYFPIVSLRKDKINIKDVFGGEARYRTSTKILDKIGLDIDKLYEGIMSREEGNDPDKIDSVFMTFSIGIKSDQRVCREYLANFFYTHANKGITKENFINVTNNNRWGPAPYTGVVIKEDNFNIAISWNWITVEEFTGQYSGYKTGYVNRSVIFREPVKLPVGGKELYNNNDLILVHQYEPNKYRIITVNGLEQGVRVFENNWVVTDLYAAWNSEGQSEGLFIPLTRNVMDIMPPMTRSDLVQTALTMVVYAADVTYVKWYQRGKILKIIALVITIVVTVIYPPAGSAAATLTALLVNTITNIIIQIIVSKIIIEVAYQVGKLVGGDIAAILATIAAISSIVIAPGNLPQAMELLNAATGLQLAYGRDMAKKMGKLKAEAAAFSKELDLKKEGIQAQLDTFTTEELLDTITMSIGLANWFESSDDYYRRTLFNTDVTELVFEVVNRYHETALVLPVTIEGVKI